MNKVYEKITEQIIKGLEETKSFSFGWNRILNLPKSASTKLAYKGSNAFILLYLGRKYKSPYWITFNKVRELGGCVKKGEKSIQLVYWKEKNLTNEQKEIREEKKSNGEWVMPNFFPVGFNVFNIEQTEGIDLKKHKLENPKTKKLNFKPVEIAEKLIGEYVLELEGGLNHGGNMAYYKPSEDKIQVPSQEDFKSVGEYYGTLFHEIIHSTGHESRTNRIGITKTAHFGGHEYSREELVAEMGSAFMTAECGLRDDGIKNNQQAYINSWIKVLKKNPKWIIEASSQAQKGIDYIKKTTEGETKNE